MVRVQYPSMVMAVYYYRWRHITVAQFFVSGYTVKFSGYRPTSCNICVKREINIDPWIPLSYDFCCKYGC